jgi:Ni,Fe-hydrogenase III small subunit
LIHFGSGHRLGADHRDGLIVASGRTEADFAAAAITARREIRKRFGRSLKLRQVSAAGCNGCEMELGACGNVNFDMGRFGVEFTASPRHADGLALTGPVSRNMAPALRDAYLSVAEPRILIAVGACAIHGGLFKNSEALDRSFLDEVRVDLFVPGCPPHPLTFIRAVLDFLGR